MRPYIKVPKRKKKKGGKEKKEVRKEQKLCKQECLRSFSQRLALVWIHSSLISLLGIEGDRDAEKKTERIFKPQSQKHSCIYMYVCVYLGVYLSV